MEQPNQSEKFTSEEWEMCIKVLKSLKDNPFENPDNPTFSGLITKIYKTAKKQNKKESYTQKKTIDLKLIQQSEVVKNALNKTTNFDTAQGKKETFNTPLEIPRNCYSCNKSYDLAHSFYHKLCPDCSDLNYNNRFLSPDLSQRNVILTGGRVKIGYATALKLLRSEANLLITTRFPALALEQFQKEKDYKEWHGRLEIYGLDLRNLKAVDEFIEYYKRKYSTLDILINNAAQTIKYTKEYYSPLIQKEQTLLQQFSNEPTLVPNSTPIGNELKALKEASHSPTLSLYEENFALNRFGQPIDPRQKTSWNSTLEEISLYELLEVNLINQISPYLLIKGFTSLFKASSFKQRFVINVTSSEGQFSYNNKTIFHPHTNMTKAALNMLTRTSAEQYAQSSIYMNCVDVGWVSTGAHEALRQKQFEQGYIPPLDPVDGAARIIHSLFEALENKWVFVGKLLKNYKIENW